MRLLFVSNYYPPHVRGGYEQWCYEVATELAARGHSVCVLTSCDNAERLKANNYTQSGSVEVHRMLHLEVEAGLAQSMMRLLGGSRGRLEQANLQHVRELVAKFQPDAALIWGMWNVPRSVPAMIEHLLGSRVAFYLCDYWPSLPSAYVQQWEAPALRGAGTVAKRILRRPIIATLDRHPKIQLRLERPICVSRAVRDVLVREGVPIDHAMVIYGGTRPHQSRLGPLRSRTPRTEGLRLLYAGRLTRTKGVHTAIHALALLAARGEHRLHLDIVGRGDDDYAAELRELVRTHGLEKRVHFRGSVPQAEMPAVMAEHDALLLLSEWEEPFARIVLEAMAAGLVVIGSLTGGTPEVLIENETGLTFPRGDANVLANQLQRLFGNPDLVRSLADAGRQRVEERFTFSRMVDQLEDALSSASRKG